MMTIQAGQLITAQFLKDFAESIKHDILEYGIVAGPGIQLDRKGKDRLSILAKKQPGESAAIEPFEAIASGGGTGTALIRVKMGTIDDRDESSGLTVLGDTGDAPDGWWEFSVPPASTRYGIAEATISSADIVTAAKFSLYATPPLTGAGDPEAGTAPPNAFHKVFRVVVDANYVATITQYDTGPMQPTVLTASVNCSTERKVIRWL